MYIDGLVKAVEVKANINQNAIKMMEANSKMIASMKPGSGTTINNNLQVNNSELDEILNNPVPQDGELD
jgi:LEA14-like dessication related protein